MSGVHIPLLLLREGSSLQQVQTLARDKMEQADMRMQRNNQVCANTMSQKANCLVCVYSVRALNVCIQCRLCEVPLVRMSVVRMPLRGNAAGPALFLGPPALRKADRVLEQKSMCYSRTCSLL